MNTTITALFTGILCFSFLLPAQDQEFEFQEINLPGDFLAKQFQDIQQDAQGFLWFASAEGAHCFDGSNYIGPESNLCGKNGALLDHNF